MENLTDEESLAEHMPWQQFITKCPYCGGQLFIKKLTVMYDKGPAVYPDGFELQDVNTKGMHTYDERVECHDCEFVGGLVYRD